MTVFMLLDKDKVNCVQRTVVTTSTFPSRPTYLQKIFIKTNITLSVKENDYKILS